MSKILKMLPLTPPRRQSLLRALCASATLCPENCTASPHKISPTRHSSLVTRHFFIPKHLVTAVAIPTFILYECHASGMMDCDKLFPNSSHQ
jgi:hypothetical protein